MWNHSAVQSYLKWAQSPTGAYALAHERALLQHMVSSWPRRGHSLLEVGCGVGIFLETLWESGFDISGLDTSPAMLEAARERLGNRAELHIGSAEHLPFEDNSYDYVALLTMLEFVENPQLVVEEAFRVATHGVVIAALNRWSAYYLSHGMGITTRKGHLASAQWKSVWELWQLIRKVYPEGRITWRSGLHTPVCMWREGRFFDVLNSGYSLSPFGAYLVMRVDLGVRSVGTPLVVRQRERAAVSMRSATILERAERSRAETTHDSSVSSFDKRSSLD